MRSVKWLSQMSFKYIGEVCKSVVMETLFEFSCDYLFQYGWTHFEISFKNVIYTLD